MMLGGKRWAMIAAALVLILALPWLAQGVGSTQQPGRGAPGVALAKGRGDAVLAATYTKVFQEGLSGYDGAADGEISAWQPDSNLSGPGHDSMQVRANDQKASLVKFDLAAIPSYAVILEAELALYAVGRETDRPLTVGAYKVLRAWNESAVTWNSRKGGIPWSQAGCNAINRDRASLATHSITLGTEVNRWYTWDVLSVVKDWVKNPQGNHGVILKAYGNTSSVQLVTLEHGGGWMRPKLTVKYRIPASTATPTRTSTPTKTRMPTRTRIPTRTPRPTRTSTYTPRPPATGTRPPYPGPVTSTPSYTPTWTATRPASSALVNGDFETGNRDGWAYGGSLGSKVQRNESAASYQLRLGSRDYDCSPAPAGSGWIEQVIGLADQDLLKLSFDYRLVSYDRNETASPLRDHLGVLVNGVRIGCWTNQQEPAGCGDDPYDTGWRSATLDLTAYKGQQVALRFACWNIDGSQKEGGTAPMNTYAYLDNIRIVRQEDVARAALDAPAPGATLQGAVTVSGWALDFAGPSGTGVSEVQVWIDGALHGRADYGHWRADMANALGDRFGPIGFSYPWDTTTVGNGSHHLDIRAHTTARGWQSVISRQVQVNNGHCDLRQALDVPANGATVSGNVTFSGWALDLGSASGTGVDKVGFWLGGPQGQGAFIGETDDFYYRPDLAQGLGARFGMSGYRFDWDSRTVGNGAQTVYVYAHSPGCGWSTPSQRVINVQNSACNVILALDVPVDHSHVPGDLRIGGWVVDTQSASGTGIERVEFWLDGPRGQGTWVGSQSSFDYRPDIAGLLGSRFGHSGFRLEWSTAGISNGAHTLYAYARSTGCGWYGPITRNITLQSCHVVVNIDFPAENHTVYGIQRFSGWTIDLKATQDTGVDRVSLWLDGPMNVGQYIGDDASFSSRPDIAAVWGNNFRYCGFSVSADTRRWDGGAHQVYVYPHSPTFGWREPEVRTFYTP